MSRGPATFKQSDATRAAKAMLAAGLDVREVVIDRAGNIRMTTQRLGDNVTTKTTGWDDA